jgi:PAS domain S-box-containing protein
LAQNYGCSVKSDLLAKIRLPAGAIANPLAVLPMIEQLFDHVPETVFFIKDRGGLYLAVNQTLVERCGLRAKRELLGRHVRAVFPRELAERYAHQDANVLRTGRPIIDRLELHWYARRQSGWCLTTKLPWRDETGKIAGLVGISRDLRAPGDRETIPKSLAGTLEHLESQYAEAVSPASLARHAGLAPVRFARLIKRIFRMTPQQLITQTRLAAAAHLLRETERSMAEIAFECGFYDHSAFTRAFRAVTDLTPTQFRGLQKE